MSTRENVYTVPALPVEAGTIVEFSCRVGNVLAGSKFGECLDGEIEAKNEPPRCLTTGLFHDLSLFDHKYLFYVICC